MKDSEDEKKITIGNTGFVKIWFDTVDEQMKKDFIKVVRKGKIRFQNSASVSSPDEAAPYYKDFLSNIRAGAKWFDEIFGVSHNITKASSWMIDSFGHSYALSRIQKQIGLKYLVITRVHTREKIIRTMNKELLYNWEVTHKQDGGIPENVTVFLIPTHYNYPLSGGRMNFNLYGIRSYFEKFKTFNGTENPMKTDKIKNFAIEVKNFTKEMKMKRKWFLNNTLFTTLGDDLDYFNAESQLEKIDTIIILIRSNNKKGSIFHKVKIKYSDAEDYIEDMRKKVDFNKLQKVEKKTDMFPLVTRISSYSNTLGNWVGYFTGRPWMKFRFQKLGNLVRRIKTFSSIYFQKSKDEKSLKELDDGEWWVGVFNHHDAITATCGLSTIYEYHQNLNSTLKKMSEIVFNSSVGNEKINKICDNWEILACEMALEKKNEIDIAIFQVDKGKTFELNLINSNKSDEVYTVESKNLKDSVRDCDLFEHYQSCIQRFSFKFENHAEKFKMKKKKNFLNNDEEIKKLNFFKIEGSKIFKIERKDLSETQVLVSLNNDDYSVELIGDNNFRFGVRWVIYYPKEGSSESNPGTYVMSADEYKPQLCHLGNLRFAEFNDKYIIRTDVNTLGTIEIIISKQADDEHIPKIEFRHHVNGYLLKQRFLRKTDLELVVQYSTEIEHNSTYFTDSNGLDVMERKYGFTGKYNESPYRLQHNYYPINRFIQVKDVKNKAEVGVYIDRPSGGTVTPDGLIHIGLQRCNNRFDDRGLEVLQAELQTISKRHVLYYGGKEVLQRIRKEQIDQEISPVVVKNFDPKNEFISQANDLLELTEIMSKRGISFDIENRNFKELLLSFVNIGGEEGVEYGDAFDILRLAAEKQGLKLGKVYEMNINYMGVYSEVKQLDELSLGKLEIKSYKVIFE